VQTKGRLILHSDMNCFYASVEIMLNPSLRGKPVAVCGSTEDRHGIVLAKSYEAKNLGVKTGMVSWEARQCCPGLIVLPPQYEEYLRCSQQAHEIYLRYTDRVEPFGMDECWLDLTGCVNLPQNGSVIAEEIRETMKEELGLPVSIGVSFNKIFAKLGSDMKKPDAVTCITTENFQEKVWPLPASDLLYVGRATDKRLSKCGIHTIGDIARADPNLLKSLFGINGLALWSFASGNDQSRVIPMDFVAPIKSLGHGITCTADLLNEEEVWKVMLELSQDIGHRLRVHELLACGVQIFVRDNALFTKQYQAQLKLPSRSPMEIAKKALELFHNHFRWATYVRAVTVRAINLIPAAQPVQLSFFHDNARRERYDKLEGAIEDIRRRFGEKAIHSACLAGDLKMPGDGRCDVIMPGVMYT